nr:immunoglobulin light chain junction region [Macaca mulatta]MOV78973.1 immunoglobulin light chain junction region [Macaca mulatta]MOV79279.1 immunoglobulin light chain junction region [Macaca mulatta]MOV79540.1 immunoglobulin light chain junction region [Macaca mulatta]MOV80105.1 immunoglobulin light chain junction region [Macaca mulatta]
CQQGYRYPYSF